MKKTRVPEYVTSRRKDLSLWQSAVAMCAHIELKKTDPSVKPNSNKVFRHPMVMAANHFVHQLNNGNRVETPRLADFTNKDEAAVYKDNYLHGYLCQYMFEHHSASIVKGNITDVSGSPLPYSDSMISAWIYCANVYTAFWSSDFPECYNDVSTVNPTIPWKIPVPSNVLILGDWATGLEDAEAFLSAAITQYSPSCIIHIGDIYYSGLSTECAANVNAILSSVFTTLQIDPIPFFSIPGNHEYIGGSFTQLDALGVPIPTAGPGSGYYGTVLGVNSNYGLPAQEASFFQLQTEDNQWQFLGMDTGYYSDNLANIIPTSNLTGYGPWLHPDEVTWLQDSIASFSAATPDAKTILLSHHQLYSANATINGFLPAGTAYLNDYLLSYFRPYFNDVAAWFWGHEHALGIFEDGLYGLPKGRLVGNSGYEEALSQNPYAQNNILIPYSQNPPVEPALTPVGAPPVAWYNHNCAVIQFDTYPAPPNVVYLDFPVWPSEPSDVGEYPQPPLTLNTIYTETLSTSNPYFIGWIANLNLNSSSMNFNNLVTSASGEYVYAAANGVVFAIDSQTGAIVNGGGAGVSLQGESGEVRLTVADGYLFASGSTYIYCLTQDGNTSMVWGSPAKPGHSGIINTYYWNGYLYAGQSGYAYQMEISSGSILSTYDFSGLFDEARFASSADYLYAGIDGDLFIFDSDSFGGEKKIKLSVWNNPVNLLVVGDTLYAGVSGYVSSYALDGTATGFSNTLVSGNLDEVRMATDGSNIYVGVDGYAASLSGDTLATNWGMVDFNSNYGITNVIYNDGYLFASCYGNIYQLNASDGSVNLKLDFEASLDVVPIALNGQGLCAMATDNIVVNNSYEMQTFITCVSQQTLT